MRVPEMAPCTGQHLKMHPIRLKSVFTQGVLWLGETEKPVCRKCELARGGGYHPTATLLPEGPLMLTHHSPS